MRIGFIGLGAMGLPMAGHLVTAGHEVTVASRSRGPIDTAVALGGHDGGTPRRVPEANAGEVLEPMGTSRRLISMDGGAVCGAGLVTIPSQG